MAPGPRFAGYAVGLALMLLCLPMALLLVAVLVGLAGMLATLVGLGGWGSALTGTFTSWVDKRLRPTLFPRLFRGSSCWR